MTFDIELEARMGKSSLEDALRKIDISILVTEYKMSKKKLKKKAKILYLSDYQIIGR